MGYFIYIKDNLTGIVKECHEDLEFSDFMWSEGNYSCDCNRHLFFTGYECMDNDAEFCNKGLIIK